MMGYVTFREKRPKIAPNSCNSRFLLFIAVHANKKFIPIKYLEVQKFISNFAIRIRILRYGTISIFADVHFGGNLD